ncbi:uncharacterized protein LOC102082390 isoform X3 [Oreochromis niloticus]|uniref:uncharacterized protein LOC102082390 isoform X3 n=1 Tax=Oreochromis niloticus TaxID=8128 RepID=UPI000DF15988|nr:uncharacterized protein LOC102082390 isoform X3 [Oreochromis niloticus]
MPHSLLVSLQQHIMEVRALCIRLLMTVNILLCRHDQNVDGSVILESPAVPVMVGDAVTLRCRIKMLSSNFTADFYKNGRHIGSSSTGNMTIHEVYKTDEGLYKCNISGGGESLASWLSVSLPCLTVSYTETHIDLILRTVFNIVMVALLLLLLGFLCCGKIKVTTTNSPAC